MGKPENQRRKLLSFFGLGVITTLGSPLLAFGRSRSKADLTAPRLAQRPQYPRSSLTRLPEFQGISQWLNSDPLTLSALAGQVVLVQFWTYACINSQRTLPYMTEWHRNYADQGLQIIGVHTPELNFEKDVNNVKAAVEKYGISYPVAIDNEFETWNAYQNRYWPHLFIANHQGEMVYHHVGEGAYAETEQMIQQLVAHS